MIMPRFDIRLTSGESVSFTGGAATTTVADLLRRARSQFAVEKRRRLPADAFLSLLYGEELLEASKTLAFYGLDSSVQPEGAEENGGVDDDGVSLHLLVRPLKVLMLGGMGPIRDTLDPDLECLMEAARTYETSDDGALEASPQQMRPPALQFVHVQMRRSEGGPPAQTFFRRAQRVLEGMGEYGMVSSEATTPEPMGHQLQRETRFDADAEVPPPSCPASPTSSLCCNKVKLSSCKLFHDSCESSTIHANTPPSSLPPSLRPSLPRHLPSSSSSSSPPSPPLLPSPLPSSHLPPISLPPSLPPLPP